MIRTILVGLGGRATEGACYTEAAIETAVELALRNNAVLTGVTIVNAASLGNVGPVPLGAAAAAAEMRERRLGETRDRVAMAVAAFEKACDDAGLRHKVLHEERQEPFGYLISQARYHDLTLIGLRGLFEYGVIGEPHYDAGDALVKLFDGGVRPIIATGPVHRPIHRVMISYSGSPQSAKAMRRFVQLRLWPEATVRVTAFGDDAERVHRRLAYAAEYFAAHEMEVELDYRPGDPKKGLLEAAHAWNADLLVMSNSHRTLILRKVLGDTVFETIRHSDLPLFLT